MTTVSSPFFGRQNLAQGSAKIRGPRLERVFAGRSGYTGTCEHSQELTPGLLEFKATGALMAFVLSMAV